MMDGMQVEADPTAKDTRGTRGARIGLVIGAIALALFVVVLGVRVKQTMAKKDAVAVERTAARERLQKREPIRTTRPTEAKWIPRVDLTGTLKPWRDADVGFETRGRLVRVNAAVGDKVTAGQILAVLDTSRAAAQVGQAESQVAANEANLALGLSSTIIIFKLGVDLQGAAT